MLSLRRLISSTEKMDKKISYFGKRFKASSTNLFCASVGGSAASFKNASASFPFKVGGGFGSIFVSSVVHYIIMMTMPYKSYAWKLEPSRTSLSCQVVVAAVVVIVTVTDLVAVLVTVADCV